VTRVLIVDDEPDILLMLRVNLEADGFETALAADGFDVTLHMSPGTAHGIAPDGLDFATSFLMANIGSDA